MESRGQAGGDGPGSSPAAEPARSGAAVHGNPATLTHDAAAGCVTLTWVEPGGIGLRVTVPERLREDELHKIAEGLRQP